MIADALDLRGLSLLSAAAVLVQALTPWVGPSSPFRLSSFAVSLFGK